MAVLPTIQAEVVSGTLQVTTGTNADSNLTVTMNGRNVRISDPNHVLLALTGVTRINEHTVEIPLANFPNGFAINGDSADSVHLNDAGLNIVGELTLSAGLFVQTQPIQVIGTRAPDELMPWTA